MKRNVLLIIMLATVSLAGCSSSNKDIEKLEENEGALIAQTQEEDYENRTDDDRKVDNINIVGDTLITIDDTDLYEMEEINVEDYFSSHSKDNESLDVEWDWDKQEIDKPGNYFVNVTSQDDLGNKKMIQIQVKIVDRSGYNWGYYVSPSDDES